MEVNFKLLSAAGFEISIGMLILRQEDPAKECVGE